MKKLAVSLLVLSSALFAEASNANETIEPLLKTQFNQVSYVMEEHGSLDASGYGIDWNISIDSINSNLFVGLGYQSTESDFGDHVYGDAVIGYQHNFNKVSALSVEAGIRMGTSNYNIWGSNDFDGSLVSATYKHAFSNKLLTTATLENFDGESDLMVGAEYQMFSGVSVGGSYDLTSDNNTVGIYLRFFN